MLDDISLFIDLIQFGSFKAAAKAKQTHATTIRRRIAVLEETLRCSLFVIDGYNQIILSDHGKHLYKTFAEPLSNLNGILNNYQLDSNVEGEITLVVSTELLDTILDSKFWQLAADYPDLKINLFNHYYAESGEMVNFDIGYTFYVPPVGHFIRQKNKALRLGLYASQEFIQQNQIPTTPWELQNQQKNLIRYINKGKTPLNKFILEHNNGDQFIIEMENNKFGTKDFEIGTILARQNQGIVALPLDCFSDLIRIMPEYTISFDIATYLVQSSSVQSAKKNLILDFIKNQLTQ